MARRIGFASVLQALLLFAGLSSVLADTVLPPYSYVVSSKDGRYLFVMLAPADAREDDYYRDETPGRMAKEMRQRYPQSGLYPNDGKPVPFWTVDWYSYSVLVAGDSHHVIRRGPWATSADDEAFALARTG